MINLYAININNEITQERIQELYSYISKQEMVRINSFNHYDDQMRSLLGKILARYMLRKVYNLRNSTIYISYNNYGKPYLKNYPYYFNISHSNSWVVCAIGNTEVGVDIERIENIDINIIKSNYTNIEYMDILNKSINDRCEYFFDIWTLKESFAKYIGKGFYIPFNTFSIIKQNEKVIFKSYIYKNPCFKQYCIGEDYKLSICSDSNSFAEKIKIINVNDINLE